MAYLDALQSRLRSLEELFSYIRTAREPDLIAFLRKVRRPNAGNEVEGYLNGLDERSTGADPATGPPQSGVKEEGSPEIKDTLIDQLTRLTSELGVDDDGFVHYFGPSSNLNLISDIPLATIYTRDNNSVFEPSPPSDGTSIDLETDQMLGEDDEELENHLLDLYWRWQHPYFFILSRPLFERDMAAARRTSPDRNSHKFFSPILLNAILAHASHFSDRPQVRADTNDPNTVGDAYFAKARQLLDSEVERPSVTTVQALAIMGSREAGCGRDTGLGWLYSGMAFRMALDLGLHLSCESLLEKGRISQEEADVRSITLWGCHLYDKYVNSFVFIVEFLTKRHRGWSAYVGRPELIPAYIIRTAPKPAINAAEEYTAWTLRENGEPQLAYTMSTAHHTWSLTEILGSVIRSLYTATSRGVPIDHQSVVTDHHLRLLSWQRDLPCHLRLSGLGSQNPPLPHVFVMQ